MREIKFRAWDIKTKTMYQDIPLITLSSHVKEKNEKLNKCLESFQSDSVKFRLMQYTGLKDKNGKEIYEGDIVKYGFKSENGIDEFVSKVFFDEYMWVTNEHSLNRISNVEVIGDIYQNPELIK